MDFSLAFASYPDCWQDAQLAEDSGFKTCWFYDMQLMSSDIYACMALAAEHTTSIQLGTGVIAASNRIAPVTASSIATINYLAPGRTILGVGVGGFSARRSMGFPPVTVKQLRTYVEQVQGLLQGEDVRYREGERERWVRLLHPKEGHINLQDQIPIYLAANGPRMLALTGAMADGWITFISGLATVKQQTESFKRGISLMAEGAKAAGRKAAKPYVSISTTGCVLRPGESLLSARPKARVGPFGIIAAHATWEATLGLQDKVAQEFSRHTSSSEEYNDYLDHYAATIGSAPDRRHLDVHTGHLMYFKPGEERFLTEEMVGSTVTGSPDQVLEQLHAWEDVGVDDVQLQVVGTAGRELIEEFSREIIARY